MAEGDTVFRWARRLEAAFDGRAIETASAPNRRSPLQGRVARLPGLRLEAAESRGKHLILNFEGGLSLHSHMGMSGSWQINGPGQAWRRPQSSAWLVLNLGEIEVAEFGGPTLRLVRKIELGRDPRLASLGPDLLDPDFNPRTAAAALAAAGAIELGEALLDQRLLAGIGNIFKSEACFEAGLSPWRKVASLGPQQLEELLWIAVRQLRHGAATGERPRQIYRRSGRPCPRCRGRIQSRGQGLDNRTTYWCPNCQDLESSFR